MSEFTDKRIIPDTAIASMGTDHIIHGGPGPLFAAGWAAACEHWSKKLLAEYPSYESDQQARDLLKTWLERLEYSDPYLDKPKVLAYFRDSSEGKA